MEGKKFQIETKAKIDGNSNLRWFMNGLTPPLLWFIFVEGKIDSLGCNNGYAFKGTEGFLKRAGILTFLKSTTQLQVWFDDVLEVTWVYEDSNVEKCNLRNKMTGLKFRTAAGRFDTVSTQYRYQLGKNFSHKVWTNFFRLHYTKMELTFHFADFWLYENSTSLRKCKLFIISML